MHALAHPLGALYDAHHGMLNAILMPYVLKANEAVIAERIELLARYLELAQPSFASFLDWVLAMRDSLGIPHTLAEIGIDARDAAKVGDMAVVDGSAGTNPIPFSQADYSRIFVSAVEGML
jgi:alcohol dehydrogenase class IV